MSVLGQFVEYLRSTYSDPTVRLLDAVGDGAAAWPQRAAVSVLVGDATLDARLATQRVRSTFLGWSHDRRVAIVDRHPYVTERAPTTFRVVAIVPTFNEADVIADTLDYLVRDEVGVFVLDNWSTDATLDIVRRFSGRGLRGLERFPSDAPPAVYDLRAILTRVEQLAANIDADWIVLHDADERRRSPWPGVSLRDALYSVDLAGFNCIDHVTLNFWPVDNGYDDGTREIESYFNYFEFSNHAGHFHQRRAWKKLPVPVSLAASAGHDCAFPGRRVFPYKFLLKHYPVRSQSHGQRKVVDERRARWNTAERALGWHQQYDDISSFVRDPSELTFFDPKSFYERRLIERLSGVGIFQAPPAWATPPMWTTPA
ncbi:MAG: glycosyltransferase family 2 protein [Chloroflexi bacterium]|nr:glycosyltransferase family 2 protein [Chloroflexota bacterium]